MAWLAVIQALWPIAVIVIPLVLGAGFIWLKTQLATKAELEAQCKQLIERLNDHAGRFERGSNKFADHDRRLALVERECEQSPSRGDLNQAISTLAARMTGVETSVRGFDKTMSTHHDYIRTLLDKEMQG